MIDYRDKIVELIDEGYLDWEDIGRVLLSWASMDDAKELYEQFDEQTIDCVGVE